MALGLRVDDEVAVADGPVAGCELEDAVEREHAASGVKYIGVR
ncbi:MAG: hypothetical protein M0005_12610 [Actinomycetota bacterium]|nr:hypothetical protein [Actinomycetota bacterium]